MTTTQENLRKQLLKKIHLNQKYKELKDMDIWGDFLFVRFEVESSKVLSINELKKLLKILDGGGDITTFKPDYKGREILIKRDDAMASVKQVNAISSLWEQKAREKTEVALRNFINIVVKKRPLHLSNLTKSEATKVITALGRL